MRSHRQIESLVFTGHSLKQMFARSISPDDLRTVVETGEAIATYPDDNPYPSELLLGFPGGRALHVVLAFNEATRTGYVITTYDPDMRIWSDDFKARRTT